MKYFEFTFDTHPCTETVNDVLAAVLGEAGFESFVEREGGLTAYIQQSLYNEETLKTELRALSSMPRAVTPPSRRSRMVTLPHGKRSDTSKS